MIKTGNGVTGWRRSHLTKILYRFWFLILVVTLSLNLVLPASAAGKGASPVELPTVPQSRVATDNPTLPTTVTAGRAGLTGNDLKNMGDRTLTAEDGASSKERR
jgi:hypothetical protein